MKKGYILGVVFSFLLLAAPALAGESSVAVGKRLFNDPALGGSANAKSCASCHPNGEGLGEAGDNPKLGAIINRCLIGPLHGTKIDGRSVEMRSLKMYIRSLKQ